MALVQLAQFLMALALAHDDWDNAYTAYLVSGDSLPRLTIERIGQQSQKYEYDTPISNILQSIPVNDSRDATLFFTAVPSDMDFGIALIRQIQTIFFLRGASLVQCQLDLRTGATTERDPAGFWATAIDVTEAQNSHQALTETGALAENPALTWQHRAWLAPWYRALTTLAGQSALTGIAAKLHENAVQASEWPIKERPAYALAEANNILKEGLTVFDAWHPPLLEPTSRDSIYMSLAFSIVGRSLVQRRKIRDDQPGLWKGNNVGAVLLDNTGKLIAWGVNMKDLNGTFHAETAMILAYLRRNELQSLPDGCQLYTTLKPCHMCAGLITTLARNITVVFGQDDKGVKNSALDRSRGIRTTQRPSIFALPSEADLCRMTPAEAAVSPIAPANHMMSAIKFLESEQAITYFNQARSRPNEHQTALENFRMLPIAPSRLIVRGVNAQPRGADAVIDGRLTPAARGRSLQAVDDVTLRRLAGRQQGRLEYDVQLSRRNRGLDLIVGDSNPIRRRDQENRGYGVDPSLKTLRKFREFLDLLKQCGLIGSAWS